MPIARKQRKLRAGAQFNFSFFHSVWGPLSWNGATQIQSGPSILVSLIQKLICRQVQSSVSQGVLNLVKLTVQISYNGNMDINVFLSSTNASEVNSIIHLLRFPFMCPCVQSPCMGTKEWASCQGINFQTDILAYPEIIEVYVYELLKSFSCIATST